MSKLAAADTQSIATCPCDVISVNPLTASAVQVVLQWPIGRSLCYRPGQYLQLDLTINDDGQSQALPYSIANSKTPEQSGRLQLFIHKGSGRAANIVSHLTELSRKRKKVKVTLAMGNAFLQTDLSLPHLLIAAGSGISKIKCLTEDILRQQPNANVNIYWSNKYADDFYLIDQFKYWAKHHKNVQFTPIVESSHGSWFGRFGYIFKVIQEDISNQNLDRTQAYLCGSPQMVYGTIDQLSANGLKEENCYSDVFDYAPRKRQVAVNTRR